MTPPEWRRLLRRGSVTDTAIRPSQFMGATKGGTFTGAGQSYRRDRCPRTFRPPSNRHPALLVAQTDPSPHTSPLNPIFMLGGAPTAHEFLSGKFLLVPLAGTRGPFRNQLRTHPEEWGATAGLWCRLASLAATDHFVLPGPHRARPGLEPVCSPSFRTWTPLTKTCLTPTEYCCGFSKVATSAIVFGSNTTTSANIPSCRKPRWSSSRFVAGSPDNRRMASVRVITFCSRTYLPRRRAKLP